MIDLDQLEHLYQLDSEDMMGSTLSLSKQLQNALNNMSSFTLPIDYPTPQKVFIVGTGGGSGFIANFVADLYNFQYSIPIFVNSGYNLPLWAEEDTLVICLSFSGNTEEILSVYQKARDNNCNIIGITQGGQLKQLILKNKDILIEIPSLNMQARSAIGHLFIPLVWVLENLGIMGSRPRHEIIEVIPQIETHCHSFKAELPETENIAKQLARKMYQRIPFFYCMETFHLSIALRWKNQLSENSKQLSHYNIVPQLHHDEIVGWENTSPFMQYIQPFMFRDLDLEGNIFSKRLNLTKTLLEVQYNQQVIEIFAKGNTLIEKLFYLIILGDWVSIYLAILNNFDPSPVNSIQKLKAMMVET